MTQQHPGDTVQGWATAALRADSAAGQSRTLWQTSLMSALLAGIYDGVTTVGEVLNHGDFGVGTFNHLDGEMVVLDGVAYHLHADGTVSDASKDDRTPFAAVVRFTEDTAIPVGHPATRHETLNKFERTVPSTNLMYAIRIDGEFDDVTTRTVREQQPPYPRFTEVTAGQATRSSGPVIGSVVGFRLPSFEEGISVAGYHLHHVTDDRRSGGHVLDFTLRRGDIRAMVVEDLQIRIPSDPAFLAANLNQGDISAQIHDTEGS